jgi:hypothetical protein
MASCAVMRFASGAAPARRRFWDTNLIPASAYRYGSKRTSIEAGIYGFISNIYFCDIEMPPRRFVTAHQNVVRHCEASHVAMASATSAADCGNS